jgi:hypothetical protein
MTKNLNRFLETWRSWQARLAFVLMSASRTRVRVEWVIELEPLTENDADEISEEVATILPGWTSHMRSDGWIRLVGPAR